MTRTETSPTRIDAFLALAVFALAWLAFANSLGGDFVYDDTRQIVKNAYIQDTRYFGKALMSDVWAFKGDAGQAWSNYWRPTFVLWLMGNFHAFGLASTVPWHVVNVLIHGLAAAFAFLLLRRWGAQSAVAGSIAALFALHPSRVESVAWISGSPDILLTLAMLGALGLVIETRRRRDAGEQPGRWRWPVAWLLAAVAMGAKEVGIVIPALVFAAVWLRPTARGTCIQRAIEAGYAAIPFALISLIYFVVRLSVIGQVTHANAPSVGVLEWFLTVPSLLAFYLRQSLFPLWIGPNYPLRAVTLDNLGTVNFWLPLLVCAAFAAFAWWVLRRGNFVQRLGLILFGLTLLPAFNIAAFIPEQLVHDRYLYLPLLGLLMALVPALFDAFARLWPEKRTGVLASVLVALACVPLLWRTVTYNTAWANELGLWEWAVKVDPTSAFNWSQYGVFLTESGRHEEARAALDRALESGTASSTPNSLIARAQVARAERRYGDAERDLRQAIAGQPGNVVAHEELALLYQTAGQNRQAIRVLDEARRAAPHHACAFTVNLAVALYLGGEKQRALNELEAVRPRIDGEANALCKQAWFRLAQLYAEAGRPDLSKAAYRSYLTASASFSDADTRQFRQLAQQALSQP